MTTIMKLLYLVILALAYVVQAEEDLTLLKEKRSLNYFQSPSHALTLNDLQQKDLLNHYEHWEYPNFHTIPSFFSHSFPTYFGANLFSPGYTLIHNLHQPFAARVAPPVSVPQAVTPKPPPNVGVTSAPLTPPATSYGVPQTQPTPYLPPSPPIPAPITLPSQVGRLGSGSLTYVHLGNGLFALGSGGLGYRPPSQQLPPPQPPQLPAYGQSSYINYNSYNNY